MLGCNYLLRLRDKRQLGLTVPRDHVLLANQQRGFTLIEALVASAILAAVIGSMTLLYQGTLTAERRAAQSLEKSTAIPFVMDLIRYQIRMERTTEGEGAFQGVEYRWHAQVLRQGKGYVDPDFAFEYSDLTERYILWRVTLYVADSAPLQYKEFSW
ncbi:PilW family protein [Aliagarivorans marinus]|uniref:PilW family protein n=1 Tax=Aliagarivorans marinus TaxID=561965 RepID=UPI00047BCBAC|nr:prepilin-type N-terminal cleavage/methylation domain-containing protein [Aliagarivorans marinus]